MKKCIRTITIWALLIVIIPLVGFKTEFFINNADNDTHNGHEYVDLGLPSGTLWATCNIGADSPLEYGNYFSWAETQPKDAYNWDVYKYCHGDGDHLTKYCSKFYYGYNYKTDTLTVLQPGDDAATANWGSGWCMPTATQWRELMENTTHKWVTMKGVKGRSFTGSNGKTLFLPANGDQWGEAVNCSGIYGYYWSRSLSIEVSRDAWCFYFDSDYCRVYDYSRIDGQAVRAVRSVE